MIRKHLYTRYAKPELFIFRTFDILKHNQSLSSTTSVASISTGLLLHDFAVATLAKKTPDIFCCFSFFLASFLFLFRFLDSG